MLAQVMLYSRTDTPDFSTRLSREELQVFTAVRGEVSVAAIVAKTRLEPALVEDTLAKLVARKLIRPAGDGNAPQAQVGSAPPPRTAVAWMRRRSAAERFLHARVGGDKAQTYSAQLRDCGSEQAYADTLSALAKRISLIVDAGVAEELLGFLEVGGELAR